MKQNTILDLGVPAPVPEDVLTEVLRQGAQKLLAEAIAAEVAGFLERYQALRTAEG